MYEYFTSRLLTLYKIHFAIAEYLLKSIKDDVHRTRKEGKDKEKETRTHWGKFSNTVRWDMN